MSESWNASIRYGLFFLCAFEMAWEIPLWSADCTRFATGSLYFSSTPLR